ncbi:hypothetical protein C8R43DRAFT_1022258 [Mycena crocata]|nr:hypothetical protein C8R43DRAFT_1022258 [Mycena crocata]
MHESLSVAKFAKLPQAIRVGAKSATDGSFNDLRKLFLLVEGMPDRNKILLLPVWFSGLDPTGIPTPAQLDSMLSAADYVQQLIPVTSAMLCLARIWKLLEKSLIPSATYVDIWPRLHQWIIFIQTYLEILPANVKPHYDGLTLGMHACILLCLEQSPSMAELAQKTPGVRTILVKYWAALVCDEAANLQDGPTGDGLSAMRTILLLLSTSAHRLPPGKHLKEILAGVGDSRDELARVLVKQITDVAARPLSQLPATILTAALSFIAVETDNQFRAALLNRGLVKAVVTAGIVLHDHTQQHKLPDAIAQAPAMGLGLLTAYFEDSMARRWVVEALESGLLRLMCLLSMNTTPNPLLPRENRFSLLEELLKNFLPGYLVYYPVACAMKECFPAIAPLIVAPAFKRCATYEMWARFAKIAGENADAVDYFESRNWKSSKTCENMQCLKIGPKHGFKSCSGCSFTYYCSSECQISDWGNGHRRWCLKLGQTRQSTPLRNDPIVTTLSDFPGPSSARDRAFLRALLQYNYKFLLKPEVLLRQAHFIYTNPGVEFFTAFDFTHSNDDPTWISVMPMSVYYHSPAAEAPMRMAQRLLSRGRMQLHAVGMNGGPTPHLLMFPLWSSSPVLWDALFRIVKSLPRGPNFADLSQTVSIQLRDLHVKYETTVKETY